MTCDLRPRLCDGAAPLDTATVQGRARIARMMALLRGQTAWNGAPAVESGAAMLPGLRGILPITDDNMGTEWRTAHPAFYLP